MKMKLALCRTLLLDRDILILDEPTLGLDVKSIKLIVEKLKNSNKTIFLTSHDMNVVEKLCDRIAFINHGNILKIGTKEDVKNLGHKDVKLAIELKNSNKIVIAELEKLDFIKDTQISDNKIVFNMKSREYYKNLLSKLSNYDIIGIQELEISLEDLFLNLS
jgi:ABC-2 type transport system ATP-binding protein